MALVRNFCQWPHPNPSPKEKDMLYQNSSDSEQKEIRVNSCNLSADKGRFVANLI